MLNVIRSYFPYPSEGPTAEYPEAAGYHRAITSAQKARVRLCMFWSPKSIAENSMSSKEAWEICSTMITGVLLGLQMGTGAKSSQVDPDISTGVCVVRKEPRRG